MQSIVKMWDVCTESGAFMSFISLYYRLLKDMHVPKKVKQIIHQTILISILIFGCESWISKKNARTAYYNSRHGSYQNDTNGLPDGTEIETKTCTDTVITAICYGLAMS